MSQLKRTSIFLLLSGIVVWLLWDRLIDIFSAGERIGQVSLPTYGLMIVIELASFFCVWWMFKILLPNTTWKNVAVSQLIANASSRVIPGGAATGSAVQFKMLKDGGVRSSEAGGAFAATSILTLGILMFLPAIAGISSFSNSSISDDLAFAIFAGPVLLILILSCSASLIFFDSPLLFVGRLIDRIGSFLASLLGKNWIKDPKRIFNERNRLVETLRGNWISAVTAAAGKWFFDCLVLYVVLNNIGASISISLLLLCYAGSAVLAMIPITPGGFGFVEVGLTSLLISSGVVDKDAELAVFVYRLMSFWFPILLGLLAGIWYKSVGGKTNKSPELSVAQ